MDNIIKNEDLVFTDNNSPDKPILGVLEGPCADFMSATRNGRKYPESLWEKVFADPIVSELIENGGIPGELDHPEDREETDSSRIAIMMTEKPTKKNGKLWAKFSILNTPLGKIAYTLAKAGFKLGISSRGSGEVYTDASGSEIVDEDSYDFKAFDLVLVPAVKSARLNLVTEGLNKNKFDYKKALKESLNEADSDDKQLMKSTLNNLNIKLESYFKLAKYVPNSGEDGMSDDKFDIFEIIEADSIDEAEAYFNPDRSQGEFVAPATEDEYEEYQVYLNEQLKNAKTDEEKEALAKDIDTLTKEQEHADDTNNPGLADAKAKEIEKLQEDVIENSSKSLDIDGSEDVETVGNNEVDILNELQENLKRIQALEEKIVDLNEKLSVCYTKEAQQEDLIENLNLNIKKLSENSKKVEILNHKTNELTEKLNTANNKLNAESVKSSKLSEKLKTVVSKYNKLVDAYDEAVAANEGLKNDAVKLEEKLNDSIKNQEIKTKQYSQNLDKANALVEKYKKVANAAADRYINSQAVRIGVKPQEIKNKLSEKYTFDEIDSICEDLSAYKLNISKLPFQTSAPLKENVNKISISPAKNEAILNETNGGFDGDDVEDLLKIINI